MWSVTEFERAARAAFSRGDRQTGTRLCLEAITKYPEDLDSVRHHTGLLADAGQHHEAHTVADQLVSGRDDVHAWRARGAVLQGLGLFQEAVVSFQHACGKPGTDGTSHFLLGSAFRAVGDHDMALSSFSKACALSPHDPDAWMQKASCLLTLSRFELASEALRDALALEHDDALPLLRRALMYAGKLDLANDTELYDDAGLGKASEQTAPLGDMTLTARYFNRQSAHPEMVDSVVTGLLDYIRAELVESHGPCGQRAIPFGLATLTLVPDEDRGWMIHEHRWDNRRSVLRPEVTDAVELMVHTGLLHRRLDVDIEACTVHDIADVDPGVFDSSGMVWHRTARRTATHSGWKLLSTTEDPQELSQLPIGELAAWNLYVVHPLTLPVGWKVYFEGTRMTGIEDPSGTLR